MFIKSSLLVQNSLANNFETSRRSCKYRNIKLVNDDELIKIEILDTIMYMHLIWYTSNLDVKC